MKIRCTLTGIYPRSEALVRATRDYDRGRISQEELEKQYERDYAQLMALQREAGCDLYSDGLLNWQDPFRPFAELVSGWEPGPLVRYFDNNTFYRQPRITGALKIDASKLELAEWLGRYVRTDLDETAPWKATLPSPYFTAHAAHDGPDHNRESLMLAYAEEVLAPIVSELRRRGVSFVQLQEPWLAFYRSDKGLSALKEALARLRRAAGPGVQWGLHTYFGDAAPHLPELLEFDLDALGVDFARTDVEALPPFAGKDLIAGCVDARSSWVEMPEQIQAFVERLQDALTPDGLYLAPNADLEFLPEAIARRKVNVLGEATRSLAGKGRGEGAA